MARTDHQGPGSPPVRRTWRPVRTAIAVVAAAAIAAGGCGHAPPTAGAGGPLPARRPPNVVLVIADDLGPNELGCFGQQRIRTPNIDALAREGARIDCFYAASPVCAPSRASLLCGLHSGHSPIRDNREVGAEGQAPIGPATPTLVHDLVGHGYEAGLFGKWGLGGPGSGSEPLDCGFGTFTGYLCQRKAHDHFPPSIWRDRSQLPLEGNPPGDRGGRSYAHDVIRDDAIAFIRRNADRPFLLVFASPLPHLALQVPDADLAAYAGAFPETPYDGKRGYLPHPTPHAAYAAMVTRLDRDVGAIVAQLRASGLERDTIVLFTADNGPASGVGGVDPEFFSSLGILRGAKGSLHEGGIRVPMVAWSPGRIPAGRTLGAPAWTVDLRATIDGWCGVPIPDGDGRDLVPWIEGRADAPASPFAGYWEFPGYGGQQAVRWGDGERAWKAVRTEMEKRGVEAPLELFDLAADPAERHDRARELPVVAADALRRMRIGHAGNPEFPLRGLDDREGASRLPPDAGAPGAPERR